MAVVNPKYDPFELGGDADTLNGQAGSYYLNRANHTGTQAIGTVSSLEEALDNLSEADSDLGGQIVAIQNTLPLKADLVGGVIPSSQIPAIAITEYLGIAADQAEMLALVGQIGDWCHRTDLEKAFIIIGEDTTDPASWKEWPMPISAVTSVNGQVGVVVLNAANIGINSSDNIAEGSSNLYFTTQRVRDATLTGFSPTNSAIISTDNVVQAFGKAQGQINALATVATSGSYNDLSDKPTIDDLNTVLHKTTTPLRERKNSGNVTPFDLNLRGMFETDYTFGANTLAVGDCYKIEYLIVVDLVTGQVGSLALTLIINGAVFDLTSELLVSLGVMTTSQHVEGVFNLSVTSIGATGRLITDGYAMHRNGAIAAYTQSFGSYNTTQPLTVNASVRFTSAPSGANTAYIKSARLIRVNNP